MGADRSLRISQVGLRGIVGTGLTASHVLDFAAAYGTFLGTKGRVVLGRDPRASGRMMREGVISALLGCGHDVVDLGVVSTPVIQHSIRRLDAVGGISIGASHNDAEWNALKFFGPRGTYLSTSESSELLDIYHLKKFDFAEWNRLGKLSFDDTAIELYIEDLAAVFNLPSLRGFQILVDCTNGTSSLILKRLMKRYGMRFILINESPGDRSFAHTPATTQRVVEMQLAPLIKHVGADAGFLFDIDSDRVALATEEGQAVSEELVMVLLADEFLHRGPGRIVIANVSTTSLLEEVAASHGGRVERVAVGRQATIDALSGFRPESIALAGEGTGAVMLPQFRFVYDGIASMLGILELIRRRGQSLSTILKSFPEYSILKGEVPLETHRIPQMMHDLERRYPQGRRNTIDGLRIDFESFWFHVRVSQTEPIVRVICEQRGDPPKELFQELMNFVRSYNS